MRYPRLAKLAKKSNTFDQFLSEVLRHVRWYEVPNVGTKADYQAVYLENKGK